jgi:gamma-glutamyltranspeptidase/glutathione hydrolase
LSETRPIVRGIKACVTSSHYLATEAGFEILLVGGNAFDAAVAVGLTLHVVEPHMNSIAGEAPALLYSAKERKVVAVSGQGTAPKRATMEFFKQEGINLIPGDGLLSAAVPASFDVWITLLKHFGTMSLRQVIAPAIRLAEQGFPLYPFLQRSIKANAQLFAKQWPTTAKIFLLHGKVPEVGQVIVQTDLGTTLRKLANAEKRGGKSRKSGLTAARDHFYSGPIAKRIVEFSSETPTLDATGEAHTGLIGVEDLANYETRLEQPVEIEYGGLTVHKCGPWSQGPVFLQQLRLLEAHGLEGILHNSPNYIHLVTEASKLAFADREGFYGDPLFANVPLTTLLSLNYAKERSKFIDMQSASLDLVPGVLPEALEQQTQPSKPHGDTTHLDVVDREGNMVSVTPSGGWITSSPIVEGLGFALGTRCEMFSLTEGHPNCIAPGKRPRTTLSPTLVTKTGKPLMSFGTPGGDQQDQWTLQFFLNYVEFGMNLQAAIDAPTFHSTHFPSSFYPRDAHPGELHLEGRIPQTARNDLERRGHRIVVDGDWVNGRVTAVHYDWENRTLSAAASPRYQTPYALGF